MDMCACIRIMQMVSGQVLDLDTVIVCQGTVAGGIFVDADGQVANICRSGIFRHDSQVDRGGIDCATGTVAQGDVERIRAAISVVMCVNQLAEIVIVEDRTYIHCSAVHS